MTALILIVVTLLFLPQPGYAQEDNTELREQFTKLANTVDSLSDEVRIRYQVGIDRITVTVNVLLGGVTVIGLVFTGAQWYQFGRFKRKSAEAQAQIEATNRLHEQAVESENGIRAQADQIAALFKDVSVVKGQAHDILERIANVFCTEIDTAEIAAGSLGMTRETTARTRQLGEFLDSFEFALSPRQRYVRAVALYNDGETEHAWELLNSLVVEGNANDDVYFATGWLCQQSNKTDEAKDRYYAALTLNKNHRLALINLAAILSAEEDYHQADNMLRRAFEIDPRDARVPINLADVAFRAGKRGYARRLIGFVQNNYDLDTEFEAQMKMNLASIEVADGNIDEAVNLVTSLHPKLTWIQQIEDDAALSQVVSTEAYGGWRSRASADIIPSP